MASKTLLDDLELPLAQCIDVEDAQTLVRHAVPGLDGDFLQRTARRAARVAVTGVVAGPESREGLEKLRDRLRGTEPVDFVADISTATRVTRVLVEALDVREVAGRPERFEYAFLLREYTPPPPPVTAPPPDDTPPPPDTETGTLAVEVIVEGEPDFDLGRVTVTAEGPASAPTSRVLATRENNVWTEADLPAGDFTVRAAVAAPPMAAAAQAEVKAGQTAQATLRLGRAAGVAKAFVVTFRFDSAFVEPCMRAVLRRAAVYAAAHTEERLVVVGHTDKTGSAAYNQSLSERRARAVFACLGFVDEPTRSVGEWTAVRQKRTGPGAPSVQDGWATREYQQMLQELGFYPGRIDGDHGPMTREAVRAFRCRKGLPPGTAVDDEVWLALIGDYLADRPPTVARDRLLANCAATKLEWIGCGEQDPVKNTEAAHRPNRRVELLFVTDAALPCTVPVPDTWALPAPGHTAAEWCLGPGDTAKRACFVSRLEPAPPRWSVEPADDAVITAQGTITREVERADGTVDTVPGGGTRFVLVASDGEFKANELGSGEPAPAQTKADGTFSFAGKRAGVYVMEVQDAVLARLAEDGAPPATGPTVCKALLTDSDRLNVVLPRDPVLREIRLPVSVHLMTALHPGTRAVRACPESLNPAVTHAQRTERDASAAADLLDAANRIWGQARVNWVLRDVVAESFATAGRDACHVSEDERNGIFAEAATPNVLNLFLFGSMEVRGEAGVHVVGRLVDGADATIRTFEAVAMADRILLKLFANADPVESTPGGPESEVILAHELGHYLSLDHVTESGPAAQRRLMLPTEAPDHRRLTPDEVKQARASENARDCGRVSVEVTGATRFGGGALGHRFVAVLDAAAPPVTVDARLSPTQLDAPGSVFTMTGGDAGASPTQRLVGGGATGRTEVIARWTPAGGGPASEAYAIVYVVEFQLEVPGGRLLAGSSPPTFVVLGTGGPAQVRAQLTPAPAVVPGDLLGWEGGEALDDPLRRRVPFGAVTEVSATVGGVTRTVLVSAVQVRLDVDADRDGTVGADESDRSVWEPGIGKKGAVLLCNLDDDDADGVEDALNDTVDGAADAQDLAPLVVRAAGALPPGVTLALVPTPRERVRVFATRTAGAAAVAGVAPAPAEHAVAGGTAGVEMGIEAVSYPVPGFDGKVRVALVLRHGATELARDEVAMRVAPWVMPSHLDPTDEVYVLKGFNSVFLADLAAATSAAGVKLKATDASGFLEEGFVDRWTQDTMEVGVSTMPGHGLQVVLDSVRTRGLDPYARAELFGPGLGFLRIATDVEENTFDSHGDLEVSPPVVVNGREFKLGRIYHGAGRPAIGAVPAQPFNPDFLAFLNAQAVQKPFAIDTSWLAVGHVDEFVSFVPAASGRSFRLVIADTPSCVKMLRALKTSGHGGLTLFTGKTQAHYGERTVDDILSNTALLDDNRLICQPRIEAVLAVMAAELGLDPVADVLRIPSLFEESEESPRRARKTAPPFFEAMIPGMVNLLCITGKSFAGHHLAMAKPFGPKLNGVDQVEAEVLRLYGTLGYAPTQVHFVDDFDTYHVAMGEVHCGTNSRRQAPATPWWEQTEF